jgi:hypothetical protein
VAEIFQPLVDMRYARLHHVTLFSDNHPTIKGRGDDTLSVCGSDSVATQTWSPAPRIRSIEDLLLPLLRHFITLDPSARSLLRPRSIRPPLHHETRALAASPAVLREAVLTPSGSLSEKIPRHYPAGSSQRHASTYVIPFCRYGRGVSGDTRRDVVYNRESTAPSS